MTTTALATPVGPRAVGRPHRPAATAAVGLGACVLVNLVDPNVEGSLGWCPFKVATGGLDCPGCGVLRGTRALTRGDVLGAMDHNLLYVLLAPVLLWGLVGWWRFERGDRPDRPTPPAALGFTLAIAVPVFWVARNLPMFDWLASGAA